MSTIVDTLVSKSFQQHVQPLVGERSIQGVLICTGCPATPSACKIVNLNSSFIRGSDNIRDTDFLVFLVRCAYHQLDDRLLFGSKIGHLVPIQDVLQRYKAVISQVKTSLSKDPKFEVLGSKALQVYDVGDLFTGVSDLGVLTLTPLATASNAGQLVQLSAMDFYQFFMKC